MNEVWILMNPELSDDDDYKTIHSFDEDCLRIFEGYQIVGHYIRHEGLIK